MNLNSPHAVAVTKVIVRRAFLVREAQIVRICRQRVEVQHGNKRMDGVRELERHRCQGGVCRVLTDVLRNRESFRLQRLRTYMSNNKNK